MSKIFAQRILFGSAVIAAVLFVYGLPPQTNDDAGAAVPATPSPPAPVPTLQPTFTRTTEPTAAPTATPTPTGTPTATPTELPAATLTTAPANTPTATRTARPTAPPAQLAPAPAEVACRPSAGQAYGVLSVLGGRTDRPAGDHADLNLGLRGWETVNAALDQMQVWGPFDTKAPQFAGLFAPRRFPKISAAYQVYHWNFDGNRRSGLVNRPAVTLIGLATTPGETLHLPDAGYDLGEGFNALVLYADATRLTLKYTREDNVAYGYTLHIEQLCVEPRLLASYAALNQAGRYQLPAVRNGQPLGGAPSAQILVGIQDAGAWMDPRSRKDWWQR
jgi:hypothetical protein